MAFLIKAIRSLGICYADMLCCLLCSRKRTEYVEAPREGPVELVLYHPARPEHLGVGEVRIGKRGVSAVLGTDKDVAFVLKNDINISVGLKDITFNCCHSCWIPSFIHLRDMFSLISCFLVPVQITTFIPRQHLKSWMSVSSGRRTGGEPTTSPFWKTLISNVFPEGRF